MIDTTVNNLIINKLTKELYDAIQYKSDTELYLIPDEIDTAPTSGSFNPVTSNGIYTSLLDKEDKSEIIAPVNTIDSSLPVTALTCEIGKYYRLDVPVETLAVTLPAMTDLTTVRTVVIYLTAGTTPAVTISSTAVSGGTSPDVVYQDGFEIEAGNTYEINALFNGAAWIVAGVKINVV